MSAAPKQGQIWASFVQHRPHLAEPGPHLIELGPPSAHIAQSWSELCPIWRNSSSPRPISPNSVKSGPTLAKLGLLWLKSPNLGRISIGPNPGQLLRQDRVDFGRTRPFLAEPGQTRPNSGQIWPNLAELSDGQFWRWFDRFRATLAKSFANSVNFGRIWSYMARLRLSFSEVGQRWEISAELGASSPNLARVGPKLAGIRPTLGGFERSRPSKAKFGLEYTDFVRILPFVGRISAPACGIASAKFGSCVCR